MNLNIATYYCGKRRILMRLLLFLLMLLLLQTNICAQDEQNVLSLPIKLTSSYSGNCKQLLSLVENQTGITISYSSKVYANQNVSVAIGTYTLHDVLSQIFSRLPVRYVVRGQKVIVAPVKPRYFTLSGYCKDALSGEVLIGANVYDTLLYVGQATNGYGFFSFILPEGQSAIRASFVGYKTVNLMLDMRTDTILSISMLPSVQMSDVTIAADREPYERSSGKSVSLSMEQIKRAPSLLGETDVIRSLECTPGVHGGEEGFGGMSVRGGNADENIVLLDDVLLYSPNHLLGLYSVFNSESVNSAELIKSGFSARYGGRISSVLDVKMREGNMKRFSGNANIGVLSSNATFEGPVLKDKMSFILSARRTYFDVFSNQIQRNVDNQYSFCFYDIHAKVNYILSPKNRLYAGLFVGYDKFGYGYNYRDVVIDYEGEISKKISINDKQKIQWGNIVGSLRWNHIFGSSLFSNTTLSMSRYRFWNMQTNYVDRGNVKYRNGYYSGINDINARIDFNWYTPFMPSVIRWGVWAVYHRFNPGISVHNTNLSETDSAYVDYDDADRMQKKRIYRLENHAYVEDEMIFDRWSVNVGLHLSAMHTPNDNGIYMRAEPRLQVGYTTSNNTHISVSYSDMTQFLQQVRVSSVASPADLWVPVAVNAGVPHSIQIAGNVVWNMPFDLEITTSLYWKKNYNLQTYRTTQMIELLLNTDWDAMFCIGKGHTHGAELFLHRKRGRFSGFAGYSFMRSVAKFDEINNGEEFLADNDRTHSVSLLGRFMITDNIDVSALWKYSTGLPVTISDNKYVIIPDNGERYSYAVEGKRNAYRMPSSHTLNIGVNIRKHKGNTERCVSFGISNIYAHQNPMFVYWENKNAGTDLPEEYKLKQFSLIAWPWPYLKYSINF